MNYQRYIRSKEWHNISEMVKDRDNRQCIVCGRKKRLSVHHLSYLWLNEDKELLEALCTLDIICHSAVHCKALLIYPSWNPEFHFIHRWKVKLPS